MMLILKTTLRHTRRFAAFLLCLVLAAVFMPPTSAYAQSTPKTVRVGWYESPFNLTDEHGRRTGYAYEYQQKIAAYSGWNYEYVKGSWPDLMQMLIDGKIDLMSDVSYTAERSALMLFSSLPMGTEEYYIFISPDNDEIKKDDLSTFNGKKVGVNQGSVQADFFRGWAKANGVHAELIELTENVDEILAMLNRGDIDMYVVLDGYLDASIAVPVCKVGASDFFFAVSRSRPDLLADLNAAMNRIQEENNYYNQQLYEKYLKASGINYYLNSEEKAWLYGHGTIRVGYQDNYLAFCGKDPVTGELTGALKDYLFYAADCLKNAHLDFEAVPYPTAEALMEALKNGRIDCMFPSNLTDYDGEMMGVFMTTPLIRTYMSAVIREADQKSFAGQEHVTVAVNQGNPNYDMFLIDHFPSWQIKYYQDTQKCLKAVANGDADCLLVSSYRFNNIASLCNKYRLIALSTGVEMDYCFAVRRTDTALYSILNKVTGLVPDSSVKAALSYYLTEDTKSSFGDFVRDNLAAFIAVIAAVAIVILLLILRNVRSEQRASAGEKLIAATEHDEMTGLYNRNYFYEFANRLYSEHPDKPADAVVINIDQFHSVNELHGRDFGDQVLRALGGEILAFLKTAGGIGSRLNVDDFCFVCTPQEDYQALLDRFHGAVNRISDNASIRLRMGVMPWKAGMEPVQLLDRAHTACSRVRGSEKRYVVYDEKMLEREHLNERLLNDLARALRKHEFKVYYQPKFNITVDPPVLSSAEALVRWDHPELGLIAPNIFIPLFEENGLIQQVDRYVRREVASQLAAWRDKYGRVFPVSVNVSRIDLYDPDFSTDILTLVKEYNVRREDFLLEITESAYTEDPEQIVQNVRNLRDAGFVIEMDDFGSGYSSLNMISTLPIDVIKLDMHFIRDAFQGHSDTRMLEAVLGIADKLYLPTVAEGVETVEQFKALKIMGCDVVQGYYFSKPVPAEQYEELIEQRMCIPEDAVPADYSRHMPRISYEEHSYEELHDPLTGVYSITAFNMLMKNTDHCHTALLLAEVVGEDRILSEQGQIIAEPVLKRVADLLKRSFRPIDHICRISDSKFAVIMSRVDSSIREQVSQKFEHINEILSRPDGKIPGVSLAVGVAFADRVDSEGSILEDAQSALNGLKERGGNGCAFH
ncbi:MAG: EAL domain-containing protein [Clostridia bacterium]|nr:EAL domain-containing protein [Clostridia bacterium]